MKDIILKVLFVAIFIFVVGFIIVSNHNATKTVVVVEGNLDKKPLEIVLGKYQDSDCGMSIDELTYASQVIAPNGKTWFFHDHGGMINWLKDKSFRDDSVIWVWAIDTNRWIDGYDAFYSVDEHTPMLYGFGAYENNNEKLISFVQMRDRMLRGENMANPIYAKYIKESVKE
ncbi:hypothetical protein [Arcobacter sp. FWKO B]|uniref:hypothetical protein n=1 Tax=Arcobacter sp. FWKO B TaxID=2593672 RepID=UPI0018A359C5|nr:hypothetical protein [Arcobacter sp. FWKO B]QOG11861.1 hypothetical protein FWKOB_03725 [Arcobacter sp. FWKO B]